MSAVRGNAKLVETMMTADSLQLAAYSPRITATWQAIPDARRGWFDDEIAIVEGRTR